MARVHIDNVRKVYAGGVEAVKGVDLDIADGEFIVLVGPSGCGKSTLLRMVAGLEQITSGTVSIGEKVVNEVNPADRDIAMVFQNYALYPHMTVYNNLAYGLRNRGTAKAEIDQRVRKAAQILEIEPLLERKPRQLSGGQRQRVAMGRAIVREPKAFLFDEPLSNLDAKLRVQMRVEIRKLQRALGTTSLYVTHDQLEAMTLGDRLVVLNGGRVEQIGSPMEVYAAPASVFVAQFIGSPGMNVMGREGLDGALRMAVPESTGQIGVRPEDLRPGAGADAALALDFTVELVEPVGAEAHVYGRAPGVADEIIVRMASADAPAPGEVVALGAGPNSLHLFDRQSGRRLD
jgi:sn-glycerol 3-phosphate transport system ATP-binding protein